MSSYQESVGIYAVGRAGHQSTKILIFLDCQERYVVWVHYSYLINLVSQGFVQYPEHKYISLFQLIDISEQFGRGKSSVPGNNAVRAFSPDRDGGAFNMSDRGLQNLFIGSVVDRQRHSYFGDLNISHYSFSGDIEQFFINFFFFLAWRKSRLFPL